MEQLRALWRSWRRDEQWAIMICLVLLSLFTGIAYGRRRTTPPLPPLFKEAENVRQTKSPATGTKVLTATSTKMVTVHVVGAVRRPGVIIMPATSRVMEAISQAGGATGEGDIQAINLAAFLKDGQQISVPTRSTSRALMAEAPAKVHTGAKKSNLSNRMAGPININTASAEELEVLPGIGPAIAARIVGHRRQYGRFEHIEDLDAVKGIGPKTLDKLRPLVIF